MVITTTMIIVFLAGLCWGSFINVFALRTLHDEQFLLGRSKCPACQTPLLWYDNIPLLSFALLRGRCRWCATTISWLYPFIEFLTALLAVGLLTLTNDWQVYMAYACFISTLLAATHTDLATMLIPRAFTLWVIPFAFLDAWMGNGLSVTLQQSIWGALLGYGILWMLAKVYYLCTRREGLGEGDMELLAMIGSCLGPLAVWVSLMVASFAGSIVGFIFMLVTKKGLQSRIPFGPFLALGALFYLFFQNWVLSFFPWIW